MPVPLLARALGAFLALPGMLAFTVPIAIGARRPLKSR